MPLEAQDASPAAMGALFFKIRTITCFVDVCGIPKENWDEEMRKCADFLNAARIFYQTKGYEVQTLRISTNFISSPVFDHVEDLIHLEQIVQRHGLTFLNAGLCLNRKTLALIPEILQRTTCTSLTYNTGADFDVDEAKEVAETILEIARRTDGKANFRFGTAARSEAAVAGPIPFFPASHAEAGLHRSFAISFENGALLYRSLSRCRTLEEVTEVFKADCNAAYRPVAALAKQLAAEHGFNFTGVDTSLAPGLTDPSIVSSFEAVLGKGYRFGYSGTLSLCSRITKAIKSLDLGCPLVGYCGCMLPVQEDAGLAQAADEGCYSIAELLQASAVCGVGIDTVPCPGPIEGDGDHNAHLTAAVANILLDVASLAHRLQKPLTCRLLPVPGKRAGERTSFNNPYLVEANIMKIGHY